MVANLALSLSGRMSDNALHCDVRRMDLPHDVTLIPGDGTGPEITRATQRVLDATGVQIRWDIRSVGQDAAEKCGDLLPKEVIHSIRQNGVALKGPVTTPRGGGFRSVNVALRKVLDLFACVRPTKSFPGALCHQEDIDIVVIRENHEDLYAGIEFELGDPLIDRISQIVEESGQGTIREDAGLSLKVISRRGSERIVRFAFDYARDNGRNQVTTVTKDNIMKHTDGLFSEIARKVAQDYPKVRHEEMLVDALAMQLVRYPERFDVLVLPNLYGDIISDLCAGLIGGLGIAPGANFGDNIAIFEAVHGSVPKYAGLNKANPMAMMLSGALMLHHLGEIEAAKRLKGSIATVIAEGKSLTRDMRANRQDPNSAGTSQVADAIVEKLKAR